MLQRFCASLCVAMLISSSLAAALPPYYQGIDELRSLINDPRIKEMHVPAGDVIEAIRRTDTGYEVVTNHSILQIDVEHLPQKHPGPAKFALHFRPVQSR